MKIKKIAIGAAVALALVLSAVGLKVKIGTSEVFAQSASYPYLSVTNGAAVNGKPSVIPTSQVIQTVTTVAAGTLNGSTSTVYDVSQINERARMVNISFNFTAVPGTSPSCTPTVKESDDGGVTWYKVFSQQATSFAAVTSTGAVTGLDFPVYGDLLEISYAASGTGNFTFTATAAQAN